MTSQVAVMNLRGIAVASDTVLSKGSDAGTKTMGNTGKIYEIGVGHNVLVLHSGSADLNGVPGNLYISEWARTLSGPLPTLQDYIESFTKWSGRDGLIHSSSSELEVITSVLSEHFSWILRLAQSMRDSKSEKETPARFKKRNQELVDSQIAIGLQFLEDLPKFPNINELVAAKILDEAGYDLDTWISEYFPEDDAPSDEGKENLRKSARLAIAKFQSLPQDCSFAFVGYGLDEPFGSSITVTCRGIYGGRLHAHLDDKFGALPDVSSSAIQHYAQGDAISAFLRGYNERIYKELRVLLEASFMELLTSDGHPIDSEHVVQEILTAIDKFSADEFIDPLLSTVEAMSMQSLGDFAGALVGLQATSTFGQKGPATVGGLVEVVTIDRANGVQWKRRLEAEGRFPI